MKIPFGMRHSDGRMVTPDSVPNGLGCDCVCRDCRLPLIAKQGAIKEWHFAHACGAECPGGVESAIHQMAKQMIMDRQYIYVPKHSLCRRISGATWAKELAADIQAEGLIDLRDCRDEVKVDTALWSSHPTPPPGLATPPPLFFLASSFCEPLAPYTAAHDPTP